MKKATFLKVINPILAIAFLLQILSVILKNQISFEIFHIIHGVGGMALTIGGLIHLILNWNWIKSTYFEKK